MSAAPHQDLHIRPMTPVDLDAVMEIAAGLGDAPLWPRSGYEAALVPGAWPHRVALVAEQQTEFAQPQIAAFLVAALVPPQAELESIAVAAEFQRKGIARQLLGELLTQLRACHCSEFFLEVRASNHPARAFYHALGFTETGRRAAYYAKPIEDAILMRLALQTRETQP
jgi:ribosomal-protein-alanine N-acetyltransferase